MGISASYTRREAGLTATTCSLLRIRMLMCIPIARRSGCEATVCRLICRLIRLLVYADLYVYLNALVTNLLLLALTSNHPLSSP